MLLDANASAAPAASGSPPVWFFNPFGALPMRSPPVYLEEIAMTIPAGSDDQAALRRANDLMKVVASPLRVAILGALAARSGARLTAPALTEAIGHPAQPLGRELDRLVDAGLALTEPPARPPGYPTFALDPQYATAAAATVAALDALLARADSGRTEEQRSAIQVALRVIAAIQTLDRLAALGALAAQPAVAHAAPDVASVLRRPPAEVEADLAALQAAGLARRLPDGYAWDSEFPLRTGKAVGTLQALVSGATPGPRPTDFRARTLHAFMPEGRVLEWPTHEKQEVVLLDEIAPAFEPERRYTEREVDAILKGIYPQDHCTLRRRMVDLRYLARDHGVYWKPAPAGAPGA